MEDRQSSISSPSDKNPLTSSLSVQSVIVDEQTSKTAKMRNHELHKLVNDQASFSLTVTSLVNNSVVKLLTATPSSLHAALTLLKQAQCILEYAASCGKNVSRGMIVAVLNNMACIYQRVWQWKECGEYLEGVVWNMQGAGKEEKNSYLVQNTASVMQNGSKVGVSASFIRKNPEVTPAYNFLPQLSRVKYNLQLCAVTSQLQQHGNSMECIRKAMKILLEVLDKTEMDREKEMEMMFSVKEKCKNRGTKNPKKDKEKQKDNEKQKERGRERQRDKDKPESKRSSKEKLPKTSRCSEFTLRSKLITFLSYPSYLSHFQLNPQELHLQSFIKSAHFALQIYQQNRKNIIKNGKQHQLVSNFIKSFSIGDLMQIAPIQIKQHSQQKQQTKLLSSFADVYSIPFPTVFSVILLAISYFSFSTELRKSLYAVQQKHLNPDYKLSQFCHLIAVVVLGISTGQSRLMDEILQSYERHYGSRLGEYRTVEEQTIEGLYDLLKIDLSREVVKRLSKKKASSQDKPLSTESLRNDYNIKHKINLEKSGVRYKQHLTTNSPFKLKSKSKNKKLLTSLNQIPSLRNIKNDLKNKSNDKIKLKGKEKKSNSKNKNSKFNKSCKSQKEIKSKTIEREREKEKEKQQSAVTSTKITSPHQFIKVTSNKSPSFKSHTKILQQYDILHPKPISKQKDSLVNEDMYFSGKKNRVQPKTKKQK